MSTIDSEMPRISPAASVPVMLPRPGEHHDAERAADVEAVHRRLDRPDDDQHRAGQRATRRWRCRRPIA